MIRIDEIYYNTFLPIVQERPNHGLHWFDPFGSVKFEDLTAMPPVNAGDKTQRYVFWDQEPINEDLFKTFADQYVKIYLGTTRLITSEYQSEFVDRVCDTYGFTPLYYFFHGWAALDWFRGYNRSFLMCPPPQRKITKTFIMPNRIVAGQRQHRLSMLYHIFKNNMHNNWISCPAVCPAENLPITHAAKNLSGLYPDIVSVFEKQLLPINFPNESNHPMHSNVLSLFDQAQECLLYLVTETVAHGRRCHLTEKIFKPICLGMPFILVSTAGSLEYLRSYGFRTFGDLWDESYDSEINDHVRMEKIAHVLKDLDTLSNKEKQQLFDRALPIIEHNYQHFYGGGFESILWQELQLMIKKFD